MQKPIITWYIEKDDGQAPIKDDFLGNVKPGEKLRIPLEIWNNRFGQEDVLSAKNCSIRIQTGKIENSFLLEEMKAYIDDSFIEPSIIKGVATINSKKSLSGLDITYSDVDRSNNKMNLLLEFDMPSNIEESLKDLIIDLSYETER